MEPNGQCFMLAQGMWKGWQGGSHYAELYFNNQNACTKGDSANDTPLVIEIAIYLLSSFLITSNYQLTTKGSQGSLPARRWHVQLQDHFPLRNAPLSTGLTTTTCNLQHVLSIWFQVAISCSRSAWPLLFHADIYSECRKCPAAKKFEIF